MISSNMIGDGGKLWLIMILHERSEETRKDSVGGALCFYYLYLLLIRFLWIKWDLTHISDDYNYFHQSHTTLSSLFRTSTSHCLLIIVIHYFQTNLYPPKGSFFCSVLVQFLQKSFIRFSFWICRLGVISFGLDRSSFIGSALNIYLFLFGFFVVSFFLSLHLFRVIDEVLRSVYLNRISEKSESLLHLKDTTFFCFHPIESPLQFPILRFPCL